ncbi:aldehyde dehydrogenase family protein [Aquincola tertiaricarbonis]|uniref:Aldehyde dehydrogenase family protein n=1 Tax=Aquincola tertiaricarbonis TaxID=391953 RepID=A0ABY4S8B5_AQUTE|nr:aldehyde dehydrogenase family protein [Aquincola tertiaricarbonis]URI07326.1 aldehyde dehydrogenase family protein [Aquincola tertiaricarbonis]
MAQVHANLIGGRWVTGAAAAENLNPSDTTDIVGVYALASAQQAREAVAAAEAAFTAWSVSTPQQRADVLDAVATEILARRDELGRLLAREEGKTLPEAIGEVVRAGHIFRYYAGEALRPGGELLASLRPGVGVEVTREPVGVVALITPWNFPVAIPAWKIAPALAWGNTVVFKPSELVPGSAWALADILHRSGLPAGAFNLVNGSGPEVGAVLVDDPRVAAVSFTGSVATGRAVVARAAARGARAQAEMGGKNPLVVLDDADLDVAVNVALQGSYYSTGQRCTASSRFIVTPGIRGRFTQALAQALRQLRVGHALAPDTQIGPVVDDRQLTKDLDYVQLGRAEGARLLCGGARLQRDTPGYFLSPALFDDARPDMRIACEEIFGPVGCIVPARDYDEALVLANATPFGLSAGLCTTSLRHAAHFKRHVQAGMVMVNVPTAGVDYHVPFGGRKASSHGPREQGRHAMDFYTAVKTAYTAA